MGEIWIKMFKNQEDFESYKGLLRAKGRTDILFMRIDCRHRTVSVRRIRTANRADTARLRKIRLRKI
jgi:hypothetical protein